MNRTLLILILFLILFAQNVFAEPQSLDKLKKEIRLYYKDGQWEKDVSLKYAQAEKIIDDFKGDRSKTAIVFDIDETVLTSYPFLEKIDFSFRAGLPQWSDWVLKADSPAMDGALKFYKKAKALGFKLFFLTGRYENTRSLTEKNLKNKGFDGYEAIINKQEYMRGKMTATEFKTAERKKLEERGYKILLNIGDQDSDLDGGYAEYTVKLPNPMYYTP